MSLKIAAMSSSVDVAEKYLLKLYQTSYLQNCIYGHQDFHLKLDIYSEGQDLRNNRWTEYPSMEALNHAADIEDR